MNILRRLLRFLGLKPRRKGPPLDLPTVTAALYAHYKPQQVNDWANQPNPLMAATKRGPR